MGIIDKLEKKKLAGKLIDNLEALNQNIGDLKEEIEKLREEMNKD